MNERIRELKNQTLDKHFCYTWSTMDYDDVTKFAEKFAELIVKECVGIVNSLEQYERQGDCSTAEYIKEHFGVD